MACTLQLWVLAPQHSDLVSVLLCIAAPRHASLFEHRFFYQGALLNGAGVDEVTKGAPFHARLALGPLVVWDCQEGRERGGGGGGPGGGGSLRNPAEAQLAATLVAGASEEQPTAVQGRTARVQ